MLERKGCHAPLLTLILSITPRLLMRSRSCSSNVLVPLRALLQGRRLVDAEPVRSRCGSVKSVIIIETGGNSCMSRWKDRLRKFPISSMMNIGKDGACEPSQREARLLLSLGVTHRHFDRPGSNWSRWQAASHPALNNVYRSQDCEALGLRRT